MTARAFVVGCSGPELTDDERAFLADAEPFGLILFRRNVVSPDQVRALTDTFRDVVGRVDAPVLVDQEGGRVQRMGSPHWPRYPAGGAFGRIGEAGGPSGREAARLGARLIAHDLRSVGVTVNCMPVLDVPFAGAHEVIGDRAYAGEPDAVASLGGAAAEGLLDGGVLPVMKHIPGHGRAGADSHERLPRVEAALDELRERDFRPFQALAHLPVAMTAHVVYEAIDPERPATISPSVIRGIVRGEIGFDGLLVTDDLSMHALSGGFRARAEAAFRAGCDIALHCNGDLSEMRGVAEAAPRLSGAGLRRAEAALSLVRRGPADGFDPVNARLAFETALAQAA